MTQCVEFSKGLIRKKYALGVTVAIEESAAVASGVDEVGAAIRSWVLQRRERAVLVTVTVVSAPQRHREIEEALTALFQNGGPLEANDGRVAVELCLLDEKGNCLVEKPIRESAR